MTTSVALSPVAILQFFDNTGKPAIGGSLQTQVGGINYPTYSEPTGVTALPNPIPLNSRGEVSTAAGASSELFLQTGVSYTFTLKDANGNQLWSVGNITSSGNGNTAVSFPTASGSANAQIITNPVSISLGAGVIQWFLPVAANTGAITINVDNTGAKNALFLTKVLVGGELQVGVPAQIIYDGTNWNLMQSAKGPMADYYVDTGTVNAIQIPANYAQTSISTGTAPAVCNGLRVKIKIANTTTANNASLDVDVNRGGQLGLPIYYSDGVTPLAAGALIANLIYDFMYDSSIGVDGSWICTNPSRVTGSYTTTFVGGPGTATVAYTIMPDGDDCSLRMPSSVAAGVGTTFTMTAPTNLIPVNQSVVPIYTEDQTGLVGAVLTVGTSSPWSFTQATNITLSGAWVASGNRGINRANQIVRYKLVS